MNKIAVCAASIVACFFISNGGGMIEAISHAKILVLAVATIFILCVFAEMKEVVDEIDDV